MIGDTIMKDMKNDTYGTLTKVTPDGVFAIKDDGYERRIFYIGEDNRLPGDDLIPYSDKVIITPDKVTIYWNKPGPFGQAELIFERDKN